MQIDPLGDSAIIVRLRGISAPGVEATEAVLAATARLRAAQITGVVEVAPAYTTVAVFYDATRVMFDALQTEITSVLSGELAIAAQQQAGRAVEIPVCYEPDFGLDLPEVAKHVGLSAQEVVRLHVSAEYRVACVGFTPGFPYLIGLPAMLATPRRRVPRREVAAGSVAIGGSQTGIYPTMSPGGWNVIGRTPVQLFAISRTPAALLRAGDVVRFRAISRMEFDSFSL